MAAGWTAYLPRTVVRDSHIALAADGQQYRRIRSADGKILHEGLVERGAANGWWDFKTAWDDGKGFARSGFALWRWNGENLQELIDDGRCFEFLPEKKRKRQRSD